MLMRSPVINKSIERRVCRRAYVRTDLSANLLVLSTRQLGSNVETD